MGLKLYLQQLTVKRKKKNSICFLSFFFVLSVFSCTENPSGNI